MTQVGGAISLVRTTVFPFSDAYSRAITMAFVDFLFGRRLSNRKQETRKIGWFEAVPAMGLDGLGSASYGPEAALTILMPLGAASLAWVGWVMAPIVALLIILIPIVLGRP